MRQVERVTPSLRKVQLALSVVVWMTILYAQPLQGQVLPDPHKSYQVEGGVMKVDTTLLKESLMLDNLRSPDSVNPGKKRKNDPDTSSVRYSILFRDTLPISRMAAISLIAPGFSQVYNKQAWKVPILYGAVGTLGYFGFKQSHEFKILRAEFENLRLMGADRETVLDPLQTKMIQKSTARTLLLGGALATYIYFLGDGVLNYNGSTSSVKKATTLSTLCPGAGQIYNKNYWKAPIIMGAIATMGFVIDYNARGYYRYNLGYNQMVEHPELPNQFSHLGKDYVKTLKNNFRRNRDLCIIIAAGLYILNIVDAHVDAHLKDYDVSDKISMRIEPTIFPLYSQQSSFSFNSAYGLSFQLTF